MVGVIDEVVERKVSFKETEFYSAVRRTSTRRSLLNTKIMI